MSYFVNMDMSPWTKGCIVVQDKRDEEEFLRLIRQHSTDGDWIAYHYDRVYKHIKPCGGYCAVPHEHPNYPWVIVIFNTVPARILETAVHEVVHLGEHYSYSKGVSLLFKAEEIRASLAAGVFEKFYADFVKRFKPEPEVVIQDKVVIREVTREDYTSAIIAGVFGFVVALMLAIVLNRYGYLPR